MSYIQDKHVLFRMLTYSYYNTKHQIVSSWFANRHTSQIGIIT